MEYSDNLISSPEAFAKMAKEYTSRLEREKFYYKDSSQIEATLLVEICNYLQKLYKLYSYIQRNVRIQKYKNFFLQMEEICKNDIAKIEDKFNFTSKEIYLKTQKLKNLNSCIKYAINFETNLIRSLINLINCQDCEFVIDMCKEHLDTIIDLLK